MTKQRHYLLYLEDIEVPMLRIQEYLSNHELDSFTKDYKTIDAVIRNFEIIGEATKNLPKEVKERYPDMPWTEMYRLRNRISHENTLELIIRLSGALQPIIYLKT